MTPGRLDLAIGVSMLTAQSSHLATCPDLGPECSRAPPPVPYYHHVSLFLGELSLDASYGVTAWLAAEVRAPFRLAKTTPTYSELDGATKLVPNDIHHHDETLVGPADPWLVARFAGAVGALTSAARLGVSLPIGSTVPDPFKLAEEGLWHEHIQFGSGTFDPIVGLGLSYRIEPVTVSASAMGVFSLYEDHYGYRAPTRLFASAIAAASFFDGKLRPYVAFDLPHQSEEYWSGSIGAEGPTARTDVLLGGGVAWRFVDPWEVELGVRARVAQLTNAASFDYPGLLQLRLATHFAVAEP